MVLIGVAVATPLGMFRGMTYEVRLVCLEPGDSVMVFTDGAIESRDKSGREFSIARLNTLFRELVQTSVTTRRSSSSKESRSGRPALNRRSRVKSLFLPAGPPVRRFSTPGILSLLIASAICIGAAAAAMMPLLSGAVPQRGGLVQRLMFLVAYIWYAGEAFSGPPAGRSETNGR